MADRPWLTSATAGYLRKSSNSLDLFKKYINTGILSFRNSCFPEFLNLKRMRRCLVPLVCNFNCVLIVLKATNHHNLVYQFARLIHDHGRNTSNSSSIRLHRSSRLPNSLNPPHNGFIPISEDNLKKTPKHPIPKTSIPPRARHLQMGRHDLVPIPQTHSSLQRSRYDGKCPRRTSKPMENRPRLSH